MRSGIFCLALGLSCGLGYAQTTVDGVFDLRGQYRQEREVQAEPWSANRKLDDIDLAQTAIGLRWQGDGDFNLVLDALAYRDGENALRVTESYVRYAPSTLSAWQSEARIGIFFPSLSIENNARFWRSPWTLSFSAINGWVAEEVRNIGLEYRLRYVGRLHDNGLDAELNLGLTGHNDVAGAALAWRGFRTTDRISGFGAELALPALPTLGDTGFFHGQDPDIAPFRESDDRPGYFWNTQWQLGAFQLKTLHWDNRATPALLEDGQYGWRTRFDHIALRWQQQDSDGNLWFAGSQLLRGDSHMGGVQTPNVVFDFDSQMLLLGWRGEQHQLALRGEHFNVNDRDQTPLDNNNQDGHALTLAWTMVWSESLTTVLEWQDLNSTRAARAYAGLAPTQQQRTSQIALQWRW